MEINIDEYLTFEDKKEIACNAFRWAVKEQFKIEYGYTAKSLMQSILGYSVKNAIIEELERMYGTDIKSALSDKLKEIIVDETSIRHVCYQSKSLYDIDGLCRKYINQYIEEHKDDIHEKVREAIEQFDYDKRVAEEVGRNVMDACDKIACASQDFFDFLKGKADKED